MKKTSIITFLICCISLCTMTTSCEDMLSPDNEHHSYKPAQDTLYSYWGILKSLQNVAERYVVLGECRGELVDGTGYLSDTIKNILDFDMSKAVDGSCRFLCASDYYHIINSCNAYLDNCDRERVTGTLDPYMLKEAAQVEAIRAWVYLQLVQVYGEVPFYTQALLTTDDIDAFMSAPEKVNIDNLADKLAPSLNKALAIEVQYGLPQYDNYGHTRTVCHSSKCMIPLNLILGDLYLAKGDAASCAIAAQYYYNYLSNSQDQGKQNFLTALPRNTCYGYQGEGDDKPEFFYSGNSPWNETGAVSSTGESITAIPSSTNKLWGTVLRGVNELYGYSSDIAVRTMETSDTTSSTMASVTLTPQYDVKQLVASKAYYDLCDAQDFEIYISSTSTDVTTGTAPLVVDTLIGDARQYWVRDVRQTYSNGISNTEKFITKQNPGGSFTTVYPMIYRKCMVWLRFAEALNGAGYPSYAFAILKNGLCKNDEWFPEANSADYAVKDSSWYVNLDSLGIFPADYADGHCATQAELGAYLAQQITDGALDSATVAQCTPSWIALTYENYPADNCDAILYYLDQREVLRSPSFLNFKDFESLAGNYNTNAIGYRTSLTSRGFINTLVSITSDDKITVGIHSNGCGALLYNEKRSTYNYVDQVIKKAQENYGVTLTKETIYDGSQDDIVQKCVEDLIVDEEALELAFEGTRFFDLLRVAHRRNDASYLANRVARRDATLQGKLLNKANWYFPLPTK